MKDALAIVRYKIKDMLKVSKRKVFNCYVTGGHVGWVSSLNDKDIDWIT